MTAIYNEIEPFAAAWLRELEQQGHIAPGVVNDRSIKDLTPADVNGPGQRHFFAGIGVWSAALRDAGVPDDANVWTGSCPCQPFSAAGSRSGTSDPRHLWPAWFALIEQCRPPIIFGEQVASKDGLVWLDLVFSDLERCGYSVGAADLCAAGVGAPHIRQRLYFVAYANEARRSKLGLVWLRKDGDAQSRDDADGRSSSGELADSVLARWSEGRTITGNGSTTWSCGSGSMAYAGQIVRRSTSKLGSGAQDAPERGEGSVDDQQRSGARSFWSNADWIACADGVSRPVEPGTFPLAHGAPARVGRLRGYGNAIVPQVAAAFITASLDAIAEAA